MPAAGARVRETLPFNPKSIPGLALWLQGKDLLNGGTLPANNAAVSTWKDKSGNGRDLTQATGSLQPSFQTAGFQGKAGVKFTGTASTQTNLVSGALNFSQPGTVFIACNFGSPLTTAQYLQDGSTNRWLINNENPGSASKLALYAGTAAIDYILPTNTLLNPSILTIQFNGSSTSVWINGTLVSTGNPGTSALDVLSLGGRNGLGGLGFNGVVGEYLVYLSALSASQRANVESYLGDLYGIAVTGPNDNAWLYRKTVTINNTSNSSTLTNYQVKVALTSSNFDFSKPQFTGADFRFLDSDGVTQLNYWLQSYDPVGQTATLWVKVPSIPGSASKTITMLFGNANTTSAANGDNTFLFFDDFTVPSWQLQTVLPAARADLASAIIGSKIYLMGGYGSTPSDVRGELYSFDTSTGAYTTLASMTPRWGLIAAAISGKIYAFGGQGTSAASTAAQMYDPGSNTWTSKATMPTAIGNEGITGCTDGTKMYLFYYGNTYVYDPVADSYTSLSAMPTAVSWATAVYYSGSIYLLGGYDPNTNQGMGYVQIYNIAGNSWTTGTTAPHGFYGAVRESPLISDNVYILHGQRISGEFSAQTYVYNITNNTWTAKAFGPHALDGPAGGVVSGVVYTFGGRQDGVGPTGLNYTAAYFPSLDTGAPKWIQIDGGFEMRAGLLTNNPASDGNTTGYQIRSNSYQTSGDVVVEFSQTVSGNNAGVYCGFYMHGDTGTYSVDLNAYTVPRYVTTSSPWSGNIYKEAGATHTALGTAGSPGTGTSSFKIVSNATSIALSENGSAYLSTTDTSLRNGYLGFVSAQQVSTSWDFILVRQYTATEPTITVT